MLHLGFLLLPIAAASGWYIAKKPTDSEYSKEFIPKNYLVGLNYILNEEPDKAVEAFVQLLDIDTETVELHFALAKLFRRQGQVERAIRIHQNLIARPNLDETKRSEALIALAKDYLSAGVLDRAEKICTEIVTNNFQFSATAYQLLIDIYEREKNWVQAIVITKKNLNWLPRKIYRYKLAIITVS